jgi:hypothetical protein
MTNSSTFKNVYYTTEQLRQYAPSVFAEHAQNDVSEKYQFVKTIDIVEHLAKLNWLPTKCNEQKVKDADNKIYAKHMIRFRHADSEPILNSTHFEVMLVNSHNRSCAYQFMAGLFRLVCSNGMVVSDGTLANIRVKHVGGNMHEIEEASFQVIESIPLVANRIKTFREINLEPAEQNVFAHTAMLARYEDEAKFPVTPSMLLNTRRGDDVGADLWHTYNRVQENLTRGGMKDRTMRDASGKRKRKMSAVRGMNEDIKLNKALWTLTEQMAKLKGMQ